jgi:nuclear pore complex protein Nup107
VEEEERYGTALDLIDLYHETAKDTAARLREQHDAEKRRRDGLKWRRKMRGFKITLDDEDMQEEDDEKRVGDQQTTVEDLTRWEQEAQTWDLLRRLVEVRFSPHSGTEEARMEPKFHRYSTEREAWDDFLQTDTLALERRTVLQWLRDTAEETGEEIDVLVHDLQQNAERGDIIAHGWIHTKAAIKLQKRLHGWPEAVDPSSSEAQRALRNSSNTESLITQLDPDAVTRQKRKLEAQDEYFERAIWLGCYEMLRRGKTASQIKEWCSERTEVWRAISMCGLPDQNADDDDHGDATSSVLWRRMCFSLARRGGSDDYERAVYGILSGDISSVEPVCRSWDDFVFAHYNALLRSQFDSYLQSRYPPKQSFGTGSNFGAFDAVQFHGDPGTTGKRLVEALKTDSRISKETLQPMKMLQGVLIANQFEHFIYQQGLALSQYANATGQSFLIPSTDEKPENDQINRYVAINDHDGLRVLTHVLLIFMGLGVNFGGAVRQLTIQNVIVAYVSFLRLAGKEELIPLYCSRLSGTRKYATLCRNLIDVTDREQRVTQINLMRELGLDAQQFVTYQAAYLFADYPEKIAATEEYPAAGRIHLLEDVNDGSGRKVKRGVFDEDEEVDRKDKLFIRSLEWYLLVDGLWSETFTIGTLIYQRFFSQYSFCFLWLSQLTFLQSICVSLQLSNWQTRCPVQLLLSPKHEHTLARASISNSWNRQAKMKT